MRLELVTSAIGTARRLRGCRWCSKPANLNCILCPAFVIVRWYSSRQLSVNVRSLSKRRQLPGLRPVSYVRAHIAGAGSSDGADRGPIART